MDRPFTLSEGVDSWNTIIFLYRSALKEVSTKVEILNDEFQQVHQYNPIEYIKSRIKSPESIVKKLKNMDTRVPLTIWWTISTISQESALFVRLRPIFTSLRR